MTPGTLSVEYAPSNLSLRQPIPQLDLASQNFGPVETYVDEYLGPSVDVTHTSMLTAVQGAIISMQPPYPNCTYNMTFIAPALECAPLSSEGLQQFQAAESDSENLYYYNSSGIVNNGGYFLRYFSWTSQGGFNASNVDLAIVGDSSSGGVDAMDTQGLFFWVFLAQFSLPDVLVGCHHRNATYDVHVNFTNGMHYFTTSKTYLAKDLYVSDSGVDNDSLGEYFDVGLSYLAMVQAFNTIFVGYLSEDPGGDISTDAPDNIHQTQVLDTLLNPMNRNWTSLDFSQSLEEVHTNMTLSYLSNPALTATTISTAQIHYNYYANIYSYQPFDLYLSYGIGIVMVAFCTAIGCRALYRNGVAYKDSWSTTLRTTRGRDLDAIMDVRPTETSGAEPLSKAIERTSVTFSHSRKSSQTDQGDSNRDFAGFSVV